MRQLVVVKDGVNYFSIEMNFANRSIDLLRELIIKYKIIENSSIWGGGGNCYICLLVPVDVYYDFLAEYERGRKEDYAKIEKQKRHIIKRHKRAKNIAYLRRKRNIIELLFKALIMCIYLSVIGYCAYKIFILYK